MRAEKWSCSTRLLISSRRERERGREGGEKREGKGGRGREGGREM